MRSILLPAKKGHGRLTCHVPLTLYRFIEHNNRYIHILMYTNTYFQNYDQYSFTFLLMNKINLQERNKPSKTNEYQLYFITLTRRNLKHMNIIYKLLVFFCSSVPVVLFDTPGISRSQHVPVESSPLLHHSI